MQIILRILAILGIILLILLLLILLVLAALLFAPFRYRVLASKEETIHADVRVHWLLHFVGFWLIYGEDGTSWVLRICGIPIKRSGKKEDGTSGEKASETEASGNKASGDGKEAFGNEASGDEVSGEEPFKNRESSEEERQAEKRSAKTDTPSPAGTRREPDSDEASQKHECADERGDGKVVSEPEKAEDIAEKPKKSLLQKIKEKIQDLRETLRCLYELFIRKKNLLRDYVKKESTKKALLDVWTEVRWLLLHIAPQRLSGNVTFGNEDPAVTGKVAAAAGVLYPMYGEKFNFVPDFQNPGISGDVEAVGRIRIFGIVVRAIKLYRNKNLRKVIKQAVDVKERMLETVPEMKKIIGKA